MKIQLLLFFAFFFSFFSFAQVITMQNGTISQCGTMFTDSGGTNANYEDNENFVLTLCPQVTGDLVELDFSFFGTQTQLDIMTIYNGDSTNSPVIGSYSGAGIANNPGTVVADNSSGCLTIHFISNGVNNTVGWLAQVNCVNAASFQVSPTCDGAIVTSVTTPGGTFAFNPTPTDGAVIDAATGTVTNATTGDTYTIEYTTDGATPVTNTEIFTVISAPTANQPTDLEICDDDGDGYGAFTLTDADFEITSGASGLTITYYETQADAANGVNSLASPYVNIVNPQTMYARVDNVNDGCNAVFVSFNLIVNTININPQSFDLFSCGYGQGIGYFDLTIYESQLTNGNSSLVVSYFQDINDANNNTNVITNPTYYENYNSPYYQEINIRIEDPNTGCVYVNNNTVLYLNIEDLQIIQPTPLVADDPDNDGFTPFDLTTKDNEITAGNPNYTVSYYETLVDADNNTNALPSPYTNIIVNQQTVYARVEDNFNGCSSIVSLELLTEYAPFQVNDATLQMCDDNNAIGTTLFDLTMANPDILSDVVASDYTVAYYEVYDDAVTQTNPITNPSSYSANPNIQAVYAGVTETATSDYVFTTIYLIIHQLPIVDFDGNLSICSGQSIVLDPNTNQPNFTYLWNTGESTPTITTNIGGFYQVTVLNPITGCTNTNSLTVADIQTPAIATPQDLVVCGANSVFDLTSTVTEIANGIDPSTLSIAFYETQADATAGTNQIQNPNVYSASSSPQTIFVAAYNSTQNTCGAFVVFNLITENCPTTVVCGQPVTASFCYANNETQQYTYTSTDGTPLQIVIVSGQVENIYDELIVLDSDGITNLNAASPYGNSGDVSNLTFAASGDTITIYVDSDGSVNCQGNNYSTIDYVVSCVDTTAIPNCDAVLITPQDLAVDVNENIDLSWTSASGYVTGYLLTVVDATGQIVLDMVDVGNVTNYDVGTLNYDTQYFVTITTFNPNGNAQNCNTSSFTTRADPNVIVDCSSGQPVNTNFCYTNNETQQYNFASNDGSSLYIVFNSGMTENNFDELIVLDSDGVTNLNVDNPYGLNNDGDLTGLTFTITGDTASVHIESDGSVISCTNDPIDFDVFCGSNLGFIEVNAFLDDNNDGIFNGIDTPFTNGFFTYEVNDDGSINTVNSNTGSFTIVNQVETNSYVITFATNAGYENCFNIPTALFENVTVLDGNTVTIDFPITEQMPCEDLAVYLIPFSSPRPGFNHWNDLVIENLGSTTINSGTVTFIHDPMVNYVGATPLDSELTVTPTVTGANVDFTNLLPGESRVVWFQLYTPATVNLGEFVTSSVVYTTAANDVVIDNNVSVITQEVIGSYDPNDITESHGRDIVYDDFVISDEYLYYTIRFQNIGTASAINVRIENTVDPFLDLSTLQFIRATHDVVMMQNGNQLTWTFDNINLPAQSQDDYGSNGYVHFKIKPTTGYAIGTIIPNTAEIYFDFNAPVITNTFETEFVAQSLSVDEYSTDDFALYPNPASSIVNIKLKNPSSGNTSVEIIDVQGKTVIQNTINETLQLNVKNIEAGLYFVKLKQNSKQTIKKLIIE